MLIGWAVLSVPAAEADETLCQGMNVSVHALDAKDTETGCKGAADAVAFLAAQGFDATARVEIRFVDTIPGGLADAPWFGCYAKAEQRVYVLTFFASQTLRLAVDLPMDRAVHRSLVAHEVAHRIAASNFKLEKPTVVANEYIAYVTMFATIAADQRDHILARFPGHGFDTERQINLTMYLLSPQHFGAQAYRHFMRAENGQSFLQRVLAGRALADEDTP
jgi:hypothetical protein